ncbi:MAG TPA: pyruvate dehydrogenase complex dihydrolipoamide acetyltransferase [Opitutaceae bacterium]|jgi:pyruvate dehydrogenase E2 component (dihydrolipoamide acetyltransferase)|nr:pyruvate dehydrogenase complex dihydrolipoamide acetyltransferase [Opitutaceae bacterium]
MADIIEMPKLSDTMTVGTLVKWLKKEGDKVASGDMLAEVETDKATMELECFFDGVILKIFTPAGSQVPLGAALCAIGKPGEKVDAPAAAAPAGQAPAAPKASAAPTAAPQPTTPSAANPAPAAAPAPAPAGGRIKISPLARKLAAAKNVDPSGLAGSGPGGRIVRADIEAAASGSGRAPAAPAPAAGGASAPAAPSSGGTFTPASNMRATVARRLLEAKTQIPHFYLDIEVDAEPLLNLRAQLNSSLEADGVKLSVNDFILKAAAEALKHVPAVNASWENGPPAGIRLHGAIHVSFAVAIDDGLITPVVRDTGAKSLVAISKEARALGKKAKEKKLAPNEFTGGTFCVSNLGMMGIDRFSAIINPPNAAILAVGATVKKPVVKGDQIVIGQRMSLTLSCDHRVVDGAIGATYLAALRELIEKPSLLLL